MEALFCLREIRTILKKEQDNNRAGQKRVVTTSLTPKKEEI